MAPKLPVHPSYSDPVTRVIDAITSDEEKLPFQTTAVYVGSVGSLSVLTVNGDQVTFYNATGWLPIRIEQIFATGTDAGNILVATSEATP